MSLSETRVNFGLDSRAADGETGSRNRKILDESELSLPCFPNSHEFGYGKRTLPGKTEVSSHHIPAPLAAALI